MGENLTTTKYRKYCSNVYDGVRFKRIDQQFMSQSEYQNGEQRRPYKYANEILMMTSQSRDALRSNHNRQVL